MKAMKILIVDDDPEMRIALEVRLRANGYVVHSAVDGVSAIAEARRIAPNLILLDLGLPAGDGFAVLERLHAMETLAQIPVIVVSGRDRYINKNLALSAGARAFLQKPVKNAELLATIKGLLNIEEEDSPAIYQLNAPTPQSPFHP